MTDAASERMARHNARQRAYYREPRRKPRMRPAITPYLQRQIDNLFETARLEPGMRVLEVGCGMGRYTLQLADRGLDVSGIDLSPELLRELERFDGGRYGLPLYCGDIADPPADLPENFDAVVGFFTLHHMHDLVRCFSAMARLVRAGGTVGFVEPNAASPLYYLQIAVTPSMTWSAERGIVRMQDTSIRRAMSAGGLTEFRSRAFGLFPPIIANLRGAGAVEDVIERVPLWRHGLSFKAFTARRPLLG
jgi:SAM-dependent methyltransferase